MNNRSWPASVLQFRANREASLRREYGWLSLAGLFWLAEGENALGSAVDCPVRLSSRAPAHAGAFTLRGGQVTVTPAAGIRMTLNDAVLTGPSQILKVDSSGETDFIFIHDLRMRVIERAGKLGIRLWDPQSPVRRDFPGCIWYPPDASYRVAARVEPYAEPRHFTVEDSTGNLRPVTMHAALAFKLDGAEYRLDAERKDDGAFDIVFKDATAGRTTYGAGRFVDSEVPVGDQVVIDFNVAYNPPCAFTEFATCPLPVPQNILPVAIEAGEKYV
ncbi:MAG: DUF1684 domain-containing protein [Anaerolineales bacterium]